MPQSISLPSAGRMGGICEMLRDESAAVCVSISAPKNSSERYIMDLSGLVDVAYEYVDLCYLQWLAWLFYPLIVTFVLPFCLLFLLYASAMFLHVYRLRHLLRSAACSMHYWDSARYFLAVLWEAQGKIWHGRDTFTRALILVWGTRLWHGRNMFTTALILVCNWRSLLN